MLPCLRSSKRGMFPVALIRHASSSSKKPLFPYNWSETPSAPSASSLNSAIETLKKTALARKATNTPIDIKLRPRFELSSTYDPFDFSLAKIQLDKKAASQPRNYDVFKLQGTNPLNLWKDASRLSQYITSNGRIISGYQLGHKPRTQKKLSKAIRRARAAGLLSSIHVAVDNLQTK